MGLGLIIAIKNKIDKRMKLKKQAQIAKTEARFMADSG
jgi:hypothetical protein